jgi:hypothetical protein
LLYICSHYFTIKQPRQMTDQELHKEVLRCITSHGSYHRASIATTISSPTLFNWRKRLPIQCRDLLKILHASGKTIKIVPHGEMAAIDNR